MENEQQEQNDWQRDYRVLGIKLIEGEQNNDAHKSQSQTLKHGSLFQPPIERPENYREQRKVQARQ
ncbi:MAG: hypothetical protein AAB869_01805 [Patescibacteria group bacterium]